MEIRMEGEQVTIAMTRDEAVRPGVAIRAGYETVSRSEYYIHTGLSQPVIRQIVDILKASDPAGLAVSIDFEPGVEGVENPRRPGPPS